MTRTAIIKTGGKQYLVHEGDELNVEKLPDTTRSLTDLLSGQTVPVTIIKHGKAKKIRVLKFRAKSRYKRLRGHRQRLTTIKIGPLS